MLWNLSHVINKMSHQIGVFRIIGIELELASSGGSCGEIFSHANIVNDVPPHEPLLQASSSSVPRIRIWSIVAS